MKLIDAKKDHFRKLSKEEGYRSRSAYKLIQLNESYRVLKPGSTVVDVGCAPGGWLQVARKAVSHSGKVVGVDIEKVAQLEGVTIFQGDIEDARTINLIAKTLNRKANTLLSDVSPKISGLWSVDHARQISLSRRSMKIATQILAKGGNAVLKIFEGELLKEFMEEAEDVFKRVHITKPTASRQR
ncbi:MAG TPA: RlmE family RNA methyltransferase, partial [Nitrososphaeraceae archaeon]|nr:RlmE family RNA methyltransferase [Nitrososphaeraceae archaeon]